MLSNLLIQNYALIETLELSPSGGLNIITGETGAGKSILLGAIGMLRGNRADTKVLWDPNQKCIIEGQFDISGYFIKSIFEEEEIDYDTTCIIRREISPSGKSRAFVNDTPVNLETLRRIGSELMDVHSQHDSILLGSQEYQLQLVDTYAQNSSLLEAYKTQFSDFRKKREAYDRLQAEAKDIRKEFDYNSFLLEELSKARFQENEQSELEKELTTLENAEEIKQKLIAATGYLNDPEQSILGWMQSVVGHLNTISGYNSVYASLRDRVQSCLIELKDVVVELESEGDSVELDDEKIVLLQERLSMLYNLQKKHNVTTVAELLGIQAELETKVSKVLNLDDDLAAAEKAAHKSWEKLEQVARKLSDSRKAVLSEIEDLVSGLLSDLGIPNGRLVVDMQLGKPSSQGIDTVNFLFSANKGIQPRQLREVASGGEFSRLMLAVKYILANKRSLPTIVFDEIDTGISGEIAIKVGNMMKDMAQGHQLIAISHLHQIAAKGDAHYFVYKDHSSDRTVSRIRQLSTEERVLEIAQMIGGAKPSSAVIENARELLSQS
ncbi:DNA repair protein RecN [Siphonobacter sp. SORGH_AS_1065]|uniref:DNA repair protein RecN n=1 Tax=Siphonobacter sp. SORGH_AS_1065 TaxID=3041795 RepID=UPI00277D2C88|nr:DNA repair protein RecN [Siphonobacter sp. SORGH_AS_1065]MDQ1086826.1 DNA repair protein RecN (Recombination protein N) [Siphonobacter sp. SORGH_AS_1065]